MAKVPGRNGSIYLSDPDNACVVFSGDTSTATLEYSNEAIDITAFGNTTRQNLANGIQNYGFSMDGFVNVPSSTACTAASILINGGSSFLQFGPNGSAADEQKWTACVVVTELSFEQSTDGAATYSMTCIPRTGSLSASTW